MHILQPILDTGDLLRSKPVLLLLAAIAFIAVILPYFSAKGPSDWLQRALSLFVVGGGGAVVLIALCKIIYSSLVAGDYTFGTIFASSTALITLFTLSTWVVKSLNDGFETIYLILLLIASLFFSLVLSTVIAVLRRVFF